LQVLRYISDHHPATMREVAAHFKQAAGHARTTVITMMERLRRKGYLKRRKAGGTYQYSPAVPKAALLQSLVRDFVDEALGGSVAPFLAFLARSREVSDENLAELKRIVRELDAQRKGERP